VERYVALYGPTKRNDLDHAKINIRSYTPTKKFPGQRC
jgi:hypothetical protein